MKKLFYTLLVVMIAATAWGQSEQLFTHYMFNRLNFNPAYAGSKDVLDAGAIYRNQWWSGIEGAPRTLNVYAHMPFADLRNGIGINLISDKIGLDKVTSIGLNYAYRIPLGKAKLAIGLNGRFEGARADWTQANGGVNIPDTGFGNDAETTSTFNAGAGVYYTHPNFYLGLSVPRFFRNSFYTIDKDKFGSDVNTYYLQGGIISQLSRNVKLYPNLQIRYNPHAPFDFDANVNLLFFDALMVGANYRYEDSVDGLLMYYFDNGLHIGVALDFTTSDLNQATTGSYEIMVGYTFPCEDCYIKNLRYF
ncbi:MAG: type IX secretion system membrane protein PorP/SprF [Saprospiraceae bacterium]